MCKEDTSRIASKASLALVAHFDFHTAILRNPDPWTRPLEVTSSLGFETIGSNALGLVPALPVIDPISSSSSTIEDEQVKMATNGQGEASSVFDRRKVSNDPTRRAEDHTRRS